GELCGKRLELLKEAVPKVARVAVLYDPANPASVLAVKELLPAPARALKLTLQPWEVRAAEDFEKVFAAMNKQHPDGLYVPGGAIIACKRKTDGGFCFKELVTVDLLQERICGCWWAHVLRFGPQGHLPARRIFR